MVEKQKLKVVPTCETWPMVFVQHGAILWMVFLAAVLFFFSFSCLAQTSSCLPVSEPTKSLEGFVLKPGKYRLTLVATSGEKKGAVANGDLILIVASRQDVSPKTGKRAYESENLADTPLYGTASVDFDSIAAPVFDLSGTNDPIYPDVLVHVIDFKGVKRQPVVVIGSVGNRRDGVLVIDGTGIGLFVQRISERDFAGTWDAWGLVRGGSGYFCAHAAEKE